VRTTFPTSVSAAEMTAAAQDYIQRGWTIAETANGICLITDEDLSGIEISGELASEVRRFLRANNLTGPVIEIPGSGHGAHLSHPDAFAQLVRRTVDRAERPVRSAP